MGLLARAVVFGCIVAALAVQTATGAPQSTRCYQKKLSNGVTLAVCPDKGLRLAALDVWVRAGSAFETADELGAAHFVEHVIFKGTTARPRGEMDLEIESVGASLNASTSRDWAHFHTTVALEHLGKAADLLADALTDPLFDPGEVALERRVILSEMASRQNQPEQVLADEVARRLYGDHPYGQTIYGTTQSVQNMISETIHGFFNRNYLGSAMTVIVVGPVEPQATIALLEQRFTAIPAGAAPSWPEPVAEVQSTGEYKLEPISEGPVWFTLGFVGPGMDRAADVWATDVVSAALVRLAGGALHERVVTTDKTALALDVGFLTQRLPAKITISGAAPAETADAAIDGIRQEIARLRREGLTSQELAEAKRFILGNYAFEIETAGGMAGSIGFYSVISSIQDSLDYAGNINKVTQQDALRVLRTYLDPDKAVVVRLSQ